MRAQRSKSLLCGMQVPGSCVPSVRPLSQCARAGAPSWCERCHCEWCKSAGHPRHRNGPKNTWTPCEGCACSVFACWSHRRCAHETSPLFIGRPRCRIGLALPVRVVAARCELPRAHGAVFAWWRAKRRTPARHGARLRAMFSWRRNMERSPKRASTCALMTLAHPHPTHPPTFTHTQWPPPPPPRCPPASPRVTSRNVAQNASAGAAPPCAARGGGYGCGQGMGSRGDVQGGVAACTQCERKSPPSHPHASPSISPVFPTQITQPAGLLKDHTALLDRVSKNVEEGVDAAVGAVLTWNKTTVLDAAMRASKNSCKTGYLADKAGKCTVCDFTLSMVPGCNACEDPGTCSGCGEGYTFVAAAASNNTLESGTCVCQTAHLSDPNCAQCAVAGSCDQCYNGYFPDPATKVCKRCSDDCRVCDSATRCNVCAEGFSLNAQGKCVPCKDGCLECADGNNGTSTCWRCKQGLYPNPANAGECIPPTASNCLQVSELSANECAVCNDLYTLGPDGVCIPCEPGCALCEGPFTPFPSKCIRCIQGYYPDSTTNGTCILPPTGRNCSQVSELSAQECVVCNPGFGLARIADDREGGLCLPCPDGCTLCTFEGAVPNPVCQACAEPASGSRFSLFNGTCVLCWPGCLECSGPPFPSPNNTCISCKLGEYPILSSGGSACGPNTIPNCAQPSNVDANQCAVCQPRYALSTDGTECVACAPNCEQCTAGPGDGPGDPVCDVCNSAYPQLCGGVCYPVNGTLTADPNPAVLHCGTCDNNCDNGDVCVQVGGGEPADPAAGWACRNPPTP